MKGRSERDHDDEGEAGRFGEDAEPGFPGEKGGLRCRTEIVPGTKSAASGFIAILMRASGPLIC